VPTPTRVPHLVCDARDSPAVAVGDSLSTSSPNAARRSRGTRGQPRPAGVETARVQVLATAPDVPRRRVACHSRGTRDGAFGHASARRARKRSSSYGPSGCRKKCSSPSRIVPKAARASARPLAVRRGGPRRVPEDTGGTGHSARHRRVDRHERRPLAVASSWAHLVTEGAFSDDGAFHRSRRGTLTR
jgi:hypothetical protein